MASKGKAINGLDCIARRSNQKHVMCWVDGKVNEFDVPNTMHIVWYQTRKEAQDHLNRKAEEERKEREEKEKIEAAKKKFLGTYYFSYSSDTNNKRTLRTQRLTYNANSGFFELDRHMP